MNQPQDQNSLAFPFIELIRSIKASDPEKFKLVELDTFFWSITRLFCFYFRILRVYAKDCPELIKHESVHLLEADIESFIIRQRIVLNDIAFLIRSLYPLTIRRFKGISGDPYQKDIEISFGDLYKGLQKNTTLHPELLNLIQKNEDWLFTLIDYRDAIIHYKAIVNVDRLEGAEFELVKCGGFGRSIKLNDSKIRVNIIEFVNIQMRNSYYFINSGVVDVLKEYIEKNKIIAQPIGITGTFCVSCLGINIFRQLNQI